MIHVTSVPLRPPGHDNTLELMQCLSKVDAKDGVQCGRCDRPATCALHDADTLATSSSIFFLCGEHLRQRMDRHPSLLKHFLGKVGARTLYAFYDSV